METVIGLPSAPAGGLHGQVFDLGIEVFLLLTAAAVQVLLEIALVVKQADGHQRHAQPAGALDVVAGEHTQAAGINRHRFVHAEFQREIGHRLGPQHSGMGSAPKRLLGQIFLESAIGVIDAAVQDQLRRPHIQPLGRELGEQRDRVVVQLAPADRIEVTKEVDDLGLPTPPEIAGQGHALIVKRLGGKSGHDGSFGDVFRGCFDRLMTVLCSGRFEMLQTAGIGEGLRHSKLFAVATSGHGWKNGKRHYIGR